MPQFWFKEPSLWFIVSGLVHRVFILVHSNTSLVIQRPHQNLSTGSKWNRDWHQKESVPSSLSWQRKEFPAFTIIPGKPAKRLQLFEIHLIALSDQTACSLALTFLFLLTFNNINRIAKTIHNNAVIKNQPDV
ncbi:hypothetical protein SAMN05428981_110115 [Bacillus sp. OV194]|nr:hypothetical protein SAMN05428981_110115 [Bacillus sp. OV194]